MSTPHAYEYALKLNKILARVVYGFIAITLAMALAISAMMPMKETVHTVYEITPAGTHLVRIMPVGGKMESNKALLESHLRRYIIARNEFFPSRVESNAELINHFSTALVMDRHKEMVAKEFEHREFSRSVTVLSLTPLTPGSYQAIYETVDFVPGLPHRLMWSAIISFSFEERAIYTEDLIFNPYGLLINTFHFTPLSPTAVLAINKPAPAPAKTK